MNVWWCNQSDSWEYERGLGVVMSSALAVSPTHRRTVGEARGGDLVVHYRRGAVVAFSRAHEDGHASDALPTGYERGWRFRTEYFDLDRGIPWAEFRDRLPRPTEKGFAVGSTGRVNQGYFFRFSLEGLSTLLELAGADAQAARFREAARGGCPFCLVEPAAVVGGNAHAVALVDHYPVAEGHLLVVPRRHLGSVFGGSPEEMAGLWDLVQAARLHLRAELGAEAFTIGVNDGAAAGQTVPHGHVHVIPRRPGDVPDPRGGIRWVIPARAPYWEGQ